ncbi:MAG TPA: DUF1934 domain-containing protein [Clostridiaceae bacterium]|nr:DUF1934 domain-containing protein [Clostridiaceae bacterium]
METRRFRPVSIQIEGTLIASDETPQVYQMAVPGRLYERQDDFRLVYRETATGLGKTMTTIHWKDETRVRIVRTGQASMTLELRPGERGMSRLTMPFGILTFDVETEGIEWNETPRGGQLKLLYILDYGNKQTVQSSMRIKYRFARDDLTNDLLNV